ncbi:non-ribosomal peptide synthetase, partial [Flavobacterium collinsii]|uniref:non-ribosomal peptide synthetase n=1 Tax=Flavobacterium collinsii TaxID=1114861 RepID=UPI0015708108
KETTLGSYDHQLAPFEKVVDRVVTTRDMSMSPLFQVMFVLQNTSESSVETEKKIKDITLSGYEFEAFNSKFDLILNVSEGNNGITLNIGYCTVLFDKTTIDRMMLHYKELLVSIVSDITRPISILPMLTVNEEYQLLDVFNDTTVAYPKNKTLIDLFEEQVKKTPDAIAVVYGGEALSYKELNEKSNQLGHYLIEQGVEPDTLVGICLDRSLEMLIGILGILKSGGAYVPVDPDYPSDRIAYMFDDTELRLVLTSRETYKILKEFTAINFVLLDKHWDIISGYSRQDLSRALSSDHLAYVIYTSGSTGRPKGVMIEHKNIVNFIVSQVKTFNVDSSDVILQFSNFAFDASVEQIFIALCSGSKLVLISKEKILDTDNFLNFLDDQKITHFHTTPSMLNTLVPRVDLKFLKRVIVGGEICNKDLILSWNKDYEFYNKYGPTEATITSTISFYDKCVCNFEVSIGTPVNNTRIYILDSQMSLLPIGVVGELCISGAGVARGYLNQEELTREKFIENPFKEGDRIYKTGDLARWLPDGNLEFIGRKDNQVKIRGYRIELGEIENVLSSVLESFIVVYWPKRIQMIPNVWLVMLLLKVSWTGPLCRNS